MIVEELVARLGFDVEGLGKLKAAGGALKGIEAQVKGFGVRLHAFAVPWAKWRAAGVLATQKIRDGIAGLIPVTGRLTAGLSAVAARTRLVTLGVLGLAAAFGFAAKKMAAFALNAAKVRNLSNAQARNAGLNVQATNLLGNAFERMGGKAADAQKFMADMNEKVATWAKEGNEELTKRGVKLKDQNGTLRDGMAVFEDILRVAQKIPKDEERRKFLTSFMEGMPDKFIDRILRAASGLKAYQGVLEETARFRPPQSLEDIFRAERLDRLAGKWETIKQGMKDAFESGAIQGMLGPLEAMAGALERVDWAQIRETFREMGAFTGGKIAELFTSLESGVPVFGKIAEFAAQTRREFDAVVAALQSIIDLGRKAVEAATPQSLKDGTAIAPGPTTTDPTTHSRLKDTLRTLGSNLDGVQTKTESLGSAIESGLNVTAHPTVDTKSIDDATKKVNALKAALEGIGALATSVGSRVSAAAAGAANLHKGSNVHTSAEPTAP